MLCSEVSSYLYCYFCFSVFSLFGFPLLFFVLEITYAYATRSRYPLIPFTTLFDVPIFDPVHPSATFITGSLKMMVL